MDGQERTKQTIQTYQWVDVLKFVFCICIIALHTAFIPAPVGYWIEKCLFRIAVPFFFVVSGFFLSKSCRERGTGMAIKRYCLRLLKILLAFSIIWILQYWIDCSLSQIGIARILIQTIQHILFHPKNGLWFVQACIVGALLLLPFLQRDRYYPAVLIGLALYSFALLCNNYYFLIHDTKLQTVVDTYMRLCLGPHNGVFVGFLYLSLGAVVEKYSDKDIPKTSIRLGICYVVYVIEIVIISKYASEADDGAFYFMQVLVAPLLLSLVISISGCFNAVHTVLLRKLSTGMYLLHMPLIWLYHRFCDYCLPSIPLLRRGQGILMSGYIKFFVILVLSWLICILAYRYTKTVKQYLM